MNNFKKGFIKICNITFSIALLLPAVCLGKWSSLMTVNTTVWEQIIWLISLIVYGTIVKHVAKFINIEEDK
jgi:hypothetical protein